MKKIKLVNESQEIAFVVYVNRETLKNLLIRLYKEYQSGDDVSFSGLLGKLMILILECEHTCIVDHALMRTLKGFEELYKSMMDENKNIYN
ncbi:hypothetical protein PO369_22335 [Phytobacter diazotrophicus]|uniref:hypothetical protein n=1 Tax=Phytobacter diazotrophicus TaxID=395631 RepID=UPI002FF6A343